MRIRVITRDERHINIVLPTGLFLNRLSASITVRVINGRIKKNGGELPFNSEAAGLIISALARWRKEHGPLNLVDIDCANGDKVLITL
jgi:hypothetical protein